MTNKQEGSNHKEMLAGCVYQTLQMSKKMKSHFSEQAKGKIDIEPFTTMEYMENDPDEELMLE